MKSDNFDAVGASTIPAAEDEWTTDSTDPSEETQSTVSTVTSDSGSQLSEGLVIARRHCGFSQATTFGALSSASVDGRPRQAAQKRESRAPSLCDQSQVSVRRRQRAEEDHWKDCTFQPKIKRKGKAHGGSVSEAGDAVPWEERLYTKEYTRRAETVRRRESEAVSSQHRKEIEEYIEHCTFHPQVTKVRNAASKGLKHDTSSSAYDRLFSDSHRNRTVGLQNEEDRKLEACTFRPEITGQANAIQRQSSVFNTLYNTKKEEPRRPPPPQQRKAKPAPGTSGAILTTNQGKWWDRMHRVATETEEKKDGLRKKYVEKEVRPPHVVRSDHGVFDRLHGGPTSGPATRSWGQLPPKVVEAPKPVARVAPPTPVPKVTADPRQPQSFGQGPRTDDEEKLRALHTIVAVHKEREDPNPYGNDTEEEIDV